MGQVSDVRPAVLFPCGDWENFTAPNTVSAEKRVHASFMDTTDLKQSHILCEIPCHEIAGRLVHQDKT